MCSTRFARISRCVVRRLWIHARSRLSPSYSVVGHVGIAAMLSRFTKVDVTEITRLSIQSPNLRCRGDDTLPKYTDTIVGGSREIGNLAVR